MSSGGIEDRTRIEPSSDEWDWASNAAPDFDIDGRPVHEFLAWAGRETGLRVVFASPESAAEARRAVLSGSVAGLRPDEALARGVADHESAQHGEKTASSSSRWRRRSLRLRRARRARASPFARA